MYIYELIYTTHSTVHMVLATDFMAQAICEQFAKEFNVSCICLNGFTGEIIACYMIKGKEE